MDDRSNNRTPKADPAGPAMSVPGAAKDGDMRTHEN